MLAYGFDERNYRLSAIQPNVYAIYWELNKGPSNSDYGLAETGSLRTGYARDAHGAEIAEQLGVDRDT